MRTRWWWRELEETTSRWWRTNRNEPWTRNVRQLEEMIRWLAGSTSTGRGHQESSLRTSERQQTSIPFKCQYRIQEQKNTIGSLQVEGQNWSWSWGAANIRRKDQQLWKKLQYMPFKILSSPSINSSNSNLNLRAALSDVLFLETQIRPSDTLSFVHLFCLS